MSGAPLMRGFGRLLRAALLRAARAGSPPRPGTPSPDASAGRARSRQRSPRSRSGSGYPGDFVGPTTLSYAPHPDGVADPGEIVWTWVPYEEDFARGKDRPVLIVGRDNGWLLAVPLTSKDHDRDAAQEAAEGRFWHDLGSGTWDASGRASEVRVNRIVRVDPGAVRRIAARLDPARFDAVAQAIRAHW
jgi:hypothetical protein